MGTISIKGLAKAFSTGNIQALARSISIVENHRNGWLELLSSVYSERTSKQRIIGITGGAGVGKSTLVGQLAGWYETNGDKVAVLAIDPSSPFSGGAFLGDRVRTAVSTASSVYFRSMATRGSTGGLASAANDVLNLLISFGFDTIILETVGVGQDEIEVVKIADAVGLVLVPGQGDAIQAMKAGLMEIADCYIVNKSDLPGADQVVADVQSMLATNDMSSERIPIVLKVAAQTGYQVAEVAEHLITLCVGTKKGDDESLITSTRQVILNLFESKLLTDPYLKEVCDSSCSILSEKNPYMLAKKYMQGSEN